MYLLKMGDVKKDVKSDFSSTSFNDVNETWTMTNVNKSTQTNSELYNEDMSSPILDKICVIM